MYPMQAYGSDRPKGAPVRLRVPTSRHEAQMLFRAFRSIGVAVALMVGVSWGAGCSSGLALLDPSSPAALIVGTWDLDEGCGGIAYRCAAPASLSEPSRYTFSHDGNVNAYRGSTQLFHTTYTVADAPSDQEGERRASLTIGGGPLVDPRPLLLRFAGTDTAYFDEGCCDRFTFRFHRVR